MRREDKEQLRRNSLDKTESKSSKQQDSKQKTIKCYNCNHMGHTSKDSTQLKREKGTWYECGDSGYMLKKEKTQITNIYEDPAVEEDFRQNVMFEIS